MDQSNQTKKFYNEYGEKEWERLFRTPQDKLNFMLHMDFLKDDIKEGLKVLDAGCGAGRFSIELSNRNCDVTMLDISEEQIRIAEEKVKKYGKINQIEKSIVGDISNLADIKDNTYDVTICYGAPLSYLYDNYVEGIKELYRVTKPGGKVLVSVNSRLGVIKTLLGRENINIVDFLARKEYWHIDQVVNDGNLPLHSEVKHPPRHFFEADELRNIFHKVGYKNLEMASSPCLTVGVPETVELISKNEKAWDTLVELELKTYRKSTTLDLGEFLMIKGRK